MRKPNRGVVTCKMCMHHQFIGDPEVEESESFYTERITYNTAERDEKPNHYCKMHNMYLDMPVVMKYNSGIYKEYHEVYSFQDNMEIDIDEENEPEKSDEWYEMKDFDPNEDTIEAEEYRVKFAGIEFGEKALKLDVHLTNLGYERSMELEGNARYCMQYSPGRELDEDDYIHDILEPSAID